MNYVDYGRIAILNILELLSQIKPINRKEYAYSKSII